MVEEQGVVIWRGEAPRRRRKRQAGQRERERRRARCLLSRARSNAITPLLLLLLHCVAAMGRRACPPARALSATSNAPRE